MLWLPDANVLIAASDENHVFNGPARTWFAGKPRFATCPITEGALVRHLVRSGGAPRAIQNALARFHSSAGHEFWPDAMSYLQADLSQVMGHRQVTDAYLVALVRSHGPDARLATLDKALARTYSAEVELIA